MWKHTHMCVSCAFLYWCVGFYDTTAENADLKNPNFRRMQDRDVIGETRDQREARERKLDREKQKKKESDPIAIMQMNK